MKRKTILLVLVILFVCTNFLTFCTLNCIESYNKLLEYLK